MGSEIVTAIIEQKGQISTNPEGLSPDVSRPIEQQTPTPSTSSEPIQQLLKLSSAAGTSKPIEQDKGASFNKLQTSPDDTFLEQRNVKRDVVGKDTPIQQKIFVTSNLRASPTGKSQLVEQRDLSRDTSSGNPMEQVAKKSNSIDLTQFDFAELIFPLCNSTKNPVSTNILWRIKDFGFDFDVGTLIFKVNGTPVQDNPEFTITAIANGLQLDYDPPVDFDFDSDVKIILTISDNAVPANNFFFRCTWRTVEDSRPPLVGLVSPVCDATNVDVRAPVVLTIIDTGAGVDQDTIQLSIEGIPVCSGITLDGLTTVSGNGFRLTWDHTEDPFRFDSSVSVSLTATDLSPLENSTLFVCCFQTKESSVPGYFDFDPFECESFVDPRTGLTFRVYGDIDGIDISTLEVRIDNKLRRVFVRPRVLRSK